MLTSSLPAACTDSETTSGDAIEAARRENSTTHRKSRPDEREPREVNFGTTPATSTTPRPIFGRPPRRLPTTTFTAAPLTPALALPSRWEAAAKESGFSDSLKRDRAKFRPTAHATVELAPCSEETDAAFDAEPVSPNGLPIKQDYVQVWVQGPDGYAKPLSSFKYNAPAVVAAARAVGGGAGGPTGPALTQSEPDSLMDDDQDVAPSRTTEDAVDSKSEGKRKEEDNKTYPQPPMPKSISRSIDFTKLTVEQRKQLWSTISATPDGPAHGGTVISPPPKGVQGISI